MIERLKPMNKYGQTAVESVKLCAGENLSPTVAWEKTAEMIFDKVPSREKGCPKNTFLSLCQAGMIKGIPEGDYTKATKNKKYAMSAIEILKINPTQVTSVDDLWKQVAGSGKAHNSQMDVVIALFENGLIVK